MFAFYSVECNSGVGMVPFKFGTGIFHDIHLHRDVDKVKKEINKK